MSRTNNKELMTKALLEVRRLKAENTELRQRKTGEPIAIVGMGCRFPGNSITPTAYWDFLKNGGNAVRKVPEDRWNLDAFTSADIDDPGKMTCPYASFIEKPDLFDGAFFGISPKEAQSLDPQQRLLLEIAWETMENANYPHSEIEGKAIGMFVGMSGIDYALKLFDSSNYANIDPYFGTGATLSPAAGRLSFFMRITGPCMVVDTACSSSLVGIHLACEALRNQECEAAFAGGVNLILSPQLSVNFSKSGLLSNDGQCYTFDSRAQGYSRGEGAGMLLLKRLSDAKADGDIIHAIIMGSAVNQDGASGGLTVPNGISQQRVIRDALNRANLTPEEIDYVETHGTATPLGDPIEAHSLGEVFKNGKSFNDPLKIGSVKTNFGHLEAAAGMASVLKLILSLKNEYIPPHLNFEEPNPHIAWNELPLKVVAQGSEWKQSERRRIGGVNGFGFAGTNAHIIIAEAPLLKPERTKPPGDNSRPEAITLSAKSPEALLGYVCKTLPYLEANEGFSEFSNSSRGGRTPFKERIACVASSREEASKHLKRFLEKGKASGVFMHRSVAQPKIAFVFTGQGAQYRGMSHKLYQNEPFYRDIIDTCAERLEELIQKDIRSIIFETPQPIESSHNATTNLFEATSNSDKLSEIDQTQFTQLSLFVVEYALARLWMQWGVQPSVVLGHSIGEYAAACIAGVMSLDDALKLVATRGKLMQEESPEGEMMTVFADESVVETLIEPVAKTLAIAAVNGPGIILVSGAKKAMATLREALDGKELRYTQMRISHAFHSPLTETILPQLKAVADSLDLHAPKIPILSNVTGEIADDSIASADYWVRHLRQRVRFCESMTELHKMKMDYLLEIGPEPTVMGLDLCFTDIRKELNSSSKWAYTLKRNQDDYKSLVENAARLWTVGVPIDWKAVYQDSKPRLTENFPTYPFQRKRHWFAFPDTSASTQALESRADSLSVTTEPFEIEVERETQVQEKTAQMTQERVFEIVVEIISEVSGVESADLEWETNLLEIGIDSLMFVRIGRQLEKRFQLTISMKAFYNSLHRVRPLVVYLLENGQFVVPLELNNPEPLRAVSNTQPPPSSVNSLHPSISQPQMDDIMRRHLALMEAYLGISKGDSFPPTQTSIAGVSTIKNSAKVDTRMRANFSGVQIDPEPGLTEKQKHYIEDLTRRIVSKTSKSKSYTQKNRQNLADWKHSLQFKQSLKQLKYPIVSDRAKGSRIYDIDGNEFIDVALGMGVHFFGHNPDFISKALHQQLDRTYSLGPQSDLAGEVARKIKQITGVERVSFSVTGSGAVMIAQRIARAATGKPEIAQFGGSYHGIGSEALMMKEDEKTIPISPGIPYNLAENVLLLDYDTEEALERIRANKDELAAVIVEPVQSRRPSHQPQRFLRQLRKLTEELGIILIFDEMINGFRIHPGGAQAWFGIQADLVTYGKIVGGSMPLSVIGGKAEYLNLIDGGFWDFEDETHPDGNTIFTGGTHNRHPLALAAANAVLDRIIEDKGKMYEALNQKTSSMIREINHFFESNAVSLKASSFGSQFRIESLTSLFEQELFHYSLLDKGIYTWEQRINCLSIAHSDADIETIIHGVKASVEDLRKGGFDLHSDSQVNRRIFPMSSVQRRLYALNQRDGAEMPYHLSGIWKLKGKIDSALIQDAFHQVIKRHESLRTAFSICDGEWVQQIVEEPRFFIESLSVQGFDPQVMIERFIRPFDLETPPLLRVGISQTSEGETYLLLDVHHIATDGLSMNIVLQEFSKLYDGIKLKPVSRQYRHAQQSLEAFESTHGAKTQAKYWKQVFNEGIPVLELPLDHPRPAVSSFSGDKRLLVISPNETKKLETFASKSGASLFMVLLSAYAALLNRLSHANEVVVGLPVGGRGDEANDHVVGMFVNSLPLKLNISSKDSLMGLLEHVKEQALNAYDNQDFPFESLIQMLHCEILPNRNPMFDVMFAFENADDRIMRTNELTLESIDQFEGSGMFDFNIDVIRENGALNVRFHYATELFDPATIERWMQYYSNILRAFSNGHDDPIQKLSIIPDSELKALEAWESGEIPADLNPTTLLDHWEHTVKKYPERTALISKDKAFSFLELDGIANAVAHQLLAQINIQPNDRLALFTDSTAESIVGMLAVQKCGAAYVPIDPTFPEDRVRFLIEDCNAKAIVSDRDFEWGSIQSVQVKLNTAPVSESPQNKLCPGSLAYIIYTSGSTGTPKGVMIEHQSIVNSILWRQKIYNYTQNDVTLQLPAITFDASVVDIYPVLFSGGCLVVNSTADKQDLRHLEHCIKTHGVTNLLATPSLYSLLLDEIATSLRQLRFVTLAGEALDQALLSRHFNCLPSTRLYNEYGPTENSVISTEAELFADTKRVSIGHPITGVTVNIVGLDDEKCPIGVFGEIVLSGENVARGYLNREELTAKAFTTLSSLQDSTVRCYRTGDIGRWLPDGSIEYQGRIDHQVKIRGYRIELSEIEARMKEIEGLDEAIVLPKGTAETKKLVAYFSTHKAIKSAAIKQHLQEKLPHYMVPQSITELESFPLTRSGKIDRKQLLDLDVTNDIHTMLEPETEAECVLHKVWSDVLKLPNLSVLDDYFSLGGDSIKGIQIVSRLKQEGWRLDMRQIFKFPTIQLLAKIIRGSNTPSSASDKLFTESTLSPIQQWFFEKIEVEPYHFNQSVWIQCQPNLQLEALKMAFNALEKAHPSLRTQYTDSGQQIKTAVQSFDFGLQQVSTETELQAEIQNIQAGLDYSKGPVWAGRLFDIGSENRLFITCHHLAIDGYSWRILLEDLNLCYSEIIEGRSPVVPSSTAYTNWVSATFPKSLSDGFATELEYWHDIVEGASPELPENSKSDGRSRTAEVSITFPQILNHKTLSKLNHVFKTDITDILLTAFRLGWNHWNPGKELFFELEAHGRDVKFDNSDVDISRTVGWFTTFYPVRFQANVTDDLYGLIRETKEQLRSIPAGGTHYLYLKEFAGSEFLNSGHTPEVSFNYLGTFSQGSANPFELSAERPQYERSERQGPLNALSLVGYEIHGETIWSIEYDASRFDASIVFELLHSFQSALEQLMEYLSIKTSEITPADCACATLDLRQWDGIFQNADLNPSDLQDAYPLTPMQEGLLYEYQLNPDSEAYFEQMTFDLEGNLDKKTFNSSWHMLVNRHPVLRSIFVSKGLKYPLQLVLKLQNFPIDWEDLTHVESETRKKKHISDYESQDRMNPFNLETGPIMRMKVFVLDEKHIHVVWSHHHILMDGWCVGILYGDWEKLYKQSLNGSTKDALPKPANYLNYLEWLKHQNRNSSKAFWKQQLADVESFTSIPESFRTSDDSQKYCYKELLHLIPLDSWELVQKSASQNNVTASALLQSVWVGVLKNYNPGVKRICYGLIVSGRPESVEHVESMVGLFINAIPVTTTVNSDTTLDDIARELQQQRLESMPHEYLPLAEIKETCPQLKELFDHLFVFENYPMDEYLREGYSEAEGGSSDVIGISNIGGYERTHLNFNLIVVPGSQGLQVKFTYNGAVYSDGFISRLRDHFIGLLNVAIDSSKSNKLSQLTMIPEAELNQLNSWNNRSGKYPTQATLPSLIESVAKRFPEHIAVKSGEADISYKDLIQRANQVANTLIKAGIRNGDRVGIWLPRSIESIIAMIGVQKAGAVYIPLDSVYPQERIQFILSDSDARILIHSDVEEFPYETKAQVIAIESMALTSSDTPTTVIKPDDGLYIIYTSGSTGQPKGCLVSHRNVVRLMINDQFEFEFSEHDTWIAAHSFCFDFSVWEVYGALIYGAKVVIAQRETVQQPHAFLDLVEREGVTILNQTPAAFYAFAEAATKNADLSRMNLRYVIFGGDRMEAKYLAPWVRKYPLEQTQLINMYGITETTVHVTFHRITRDEIEEGSGTSIIGHPLPETEVWVLNEYLKPVPIGVTGEMYVSGSGVSSGYLNHPELNTQRFIDNPLSGVGKIYKTGDLGRWTENGTLEYLGRNDYQVQIRGFRVETGEIETILLRMPEIEKAFVMPFEESPGVMALIVYLQGDEKPSQIIRSNLETTLPSYMVPNRFIWLEQFPLTSNGKIDRKALPTPGSIDEDKQNEAPRNVIEEQLVDIWKNVLQIEALGIDDNFFDLGGQSLKAFRMVSEIQTHLGVEFSIKELLGHATIRGLSESGKFKRYPILEDNKLDDEAKSLLAEFSPEEIEAYLNKLETEESI